MPQRILLLMDNHRDSNWGSQASTSMLVELLRAEFPEAEIQGVPRDLAGHRGFYRRIGERCLPDALNGHGWASTKCRLGLWATTQKWRNLLDWPDLIVVNGEGTLHGQLQVKRWLPLIDYVRRRTGAPLWVVNSSLVIKDSKDCSFFHEVIDYADRFILREPVSYRHAMDMGFHGELAADCAFLAEADEEFDVDALLSQKGVNRPFALVTGSAISHRWDFDAEREMIEEVRRHGLDVLYSASVDDDMELYERLDLKLPIITEREIDPYQLIAITREAAVLVGGRFHPTIFAATVGTPFIASASNTHKMTGLMEQLGTPELLIAQSDLQARKSMLAQILERRAEYSQKLRTRADELRQDARRNSAAMADRSLTPDLGLSRPPVGLLSGAATVLAFVGFVATPNSWLIFTALALAVSVASMCRRPGISSCRVVAAACMALAVGSIAGDVRDGGLIDNAQTHGHITSMPWYFGF